MKQLKYNYTFTAILLLATACSRENKSLPDEDYRNIFKIDTTIDTPDRSEGYENMFTTPCDPETDENNFVYPGVVIDEEIRDYTVTIKLYLKEENHLNHNSPLYSKFFVRYVNEEKKLVSLNSQELFGKSNYREGGSVEITYKAQSGLPMYLAIVGDGYGRFTLKASIQAESEDKLIKTPKLDFDYYNSFDGLGMIDPSYCEKIILP